jgi:hypothetical protein
MAENGMGASVEILMSARKQGLRVKEVSTSCDYAGDVRKHVHNPLRHGVGVIMSIVKLVVEDRPLTFMGIPGAVFLAAGICFGVWMMQIYAAVHYIAFGVALATLSFLMLGFFLLTTSITLYAIARLAEKTNSKR